jgi:hypothetical protein
MFTYHQYDVALVAILVPAHAKASTVFHKSESIFFISHVTNFESLGCWVWRRICIASKLFEGYGALADLNVGSEIQTVALVDVGSN